MKAESTNIIELKSLQTRKDILCEELKIEIRDYISNFKNAKQGLEDLSEKSGVSARSLRRYETGEFSPQLNNALKIYKAIYPDCKDLEEFKSRLPGSVVEILSETKEFENLTFCNVDRTRTFNNKMKDDAIFRKIINLEAMSNGKAPLTRDWIRFKLGELGEETLDEIISMQFMSEKDGVLRVIEANIPSFDDELYYTNAMELAKEFDPKKMDDADKNLAGYLAYGVTEEAYAEIAEEAKKFFEKVQKISEKKENRGAVKYSLSTVLDMKNY